MPIITKAGTPVKGSPTQFTLDKSALAAVTSVAADAYYSDSTNWKEVQLNYKSSTGKQKEVVKFDASLASPTANFAVSLKARDVFEIHNIVIKDFDGGSFQVPRSALTTADFDVDMGSPAISVSAFSPTLKDSLVTLSNNNFTASGYTSGFTGYLFPIYDASPVSISSGKYYKEFTLTNEGWFQATSGKIFGIRVFPTGQQPSLFSVASPNDLIDGQASLFLHRASLTVTKINSTGNTQSVSTPGYNNPWGADFNSGDVFGIAVDFSGPNKKFYVSRNGVWANSANPTAGTGGIDINSEIPTLPSVGDVYFFTVSDKDRVIDINQSPLYLPSGYTAV